MEVHRLVRHNEDYAREMAAKIDWSEVETRAAELAACGRRWFQRAKDFLHQMGIDFTNPLELMLAARKISPNEFERVGLRGEDSPAQPTDLLEITNRETKAITTAVQGSGLRCDQIRVTVASTDVHWPAKSIIEHVLQESGALVVDGGVAADPERLVEQATDEDCAAMVITTHNGWALNFGQRLVEECKRTGADGLTIIMGGVLNEDAGPGANNELPRDVTAALNELGIITTNDFLVMVENLGQLAPTC